MSVTADQSWVYQFHDNILLCYQQMKSLLSNVLDPAMIHRNVRAAIDHHERMGNVVANDVVSPFAELVPLNPAHSRRAVRLQSSDATVWVSDEHTMRSMIEPNNAYTQTLVGACSRRADKHIIDALTGTATTSLVTAGTGAITTGTAAMFSLNVIGAATAVDLARIINANERLSKGGASNGAGERYFLYSPGQLRDILAITQASSSDFTKNQIHDKGTINGVDWEGFRWIEIADVVDPSLAATLTTRMLALTSTTRSCIAFHKSAIGLSVGKDLTTKIDPLPHRGDTIQIRTSMAQGAVRVWEGGVVTVNCLEN